VRRFDFSAPTPKQSEASAHALSTIRQGIEFGDRRTLALVLNLDAALSGLDSGPLSETFGAIDEGALGRATGYDPGYEARVRSIMTALELAFTRGVLYAEEIAPGGV